MGRVREVESSSLALLGVLKARPALLLGDESGANFHSRPSGRANSFRSDYLVCGKVAALNLGRKFVREEGMNDEGKIW